MPRVAVPNADPYVAETEQELAQRLDRYFELDKAIEDRGPGSVRAQQLARCFANAAQTMSGPWFKALGAARSNVSTRAAVDRIVCARLGTVSVRFPWH